MYIEASRTNLTLQGSYRARLGFQWIPSRHPQPSILLIPRIVGTSCAVHMWRCRFPVLRGGYGQERQVPVPGWSAPRWRHRRGVELSRSDGSSPRHAWPRNL